MQRVITTTNFIFVGPPTTQEIIIYLKNKKYSLINNPSLKYQIQYRKENKFFDKRNFDFVKKENSFSKKEFVFEQFSLIFQKNIILYCKRDLVNYNFFRTWRYDKTNKKTKQDELITSYKEKSANESKNLIKLCNETILLNIAGLNTEEGGRNKLNYLIRSNDEKGVGPKRVKLENTKLSDKVVEINSGEALTGDFNDSYKDFKRVHFNLEENEVITYQQKLKKGKALQEVTNKKPKDSTENKQEEDLKKNISLVEKNDLYKNRYKLKKLTMKNTRLNAGYKTIILKHSRIISFINQNCERKTSSKRKTAIKVKFIQKDIISPHNKNGIRNMLVEKPKIKRFVLPKNKKVVELKRYVSLEFGNNDFQFERKNKKTKIE